MPYGDIDRDQHWLRWWLDAWWHQVIASTIIDFSSVLSCSIHMRVISWEMLETSIHDEFENYWFMITGTYPRGQRVMSKICICISDHSWHGTGSLNYSSCKTWTYGFYINIMAADALVMQRVRASTGMVQSSAAITRFLGSKKSIAL